MSTHNKGFYEDLTTIIFQLSSNIIKYAPYLFFWLKKTIYHVYFDYFQDKLYEIEKLPASKKIPPCLAKEYM